MVDNGEIIISLTFLQSILCIAITHRHCFSGEDFFVLRVHKKLLESTFCEFGLYLSSADTNFKESSKAKQSQSLHETVLVLPI